ncbi:MAG TPA: hypothetical protein VFY27_01340 [Woeseiaceae bacterium]|nr:hypothetical protein [Woeseiaceae bacterium]
MTDKPIIGIALGGGAARGWAHIGVLGALREPADAEHQEELSYLDRMQHYMRGLLEPSSDPPDRGPALLDVVNSAINIMQERVARSRLAGDPPELEIVPDVQDIRLMDFHRAALAVERGVEAVHARAADISRLLQISEANG